MDFKDIAVRMVDALRKGIVSSMAILAISGPFCAVVLLGGTSSETVDSNVLTISPVTAAAWQSLRSPSLPKVADLDPRSVAPPNDQMPLAVVDASVAPDRRVSLTRTLQHKLRRLGCYHGEIDGIWTSALSDAAKAFARLSKAKLSDHEPVEVLLSLMQRNGRIACIRHCQSTHAQAACLEEAAANSLHVERSASPSAKLSAPGPSPEPPTALNGPKVNLDVPAKLAPGQPKSSQTPPSSAPDPQITLVLKADLGAQQLTVLEGDTVVRVWPISSGMDGYPTPIGTFQPKSANRMWYSRQYNWTPMPYAVFFSRGVAFHGTDATSRLGTSASHGCIRLATSNAAELFDLVHKHGFERTSIIVFGTPKHDRAAMVRRAPSVTRESLHTVTRRSMPQFNSLPSWLGPAFNP